MLYLFYFFPPLILPNSAPKCISEHIFFRIVRETSAPSLYTYSASCTLHFVRAAHIGIYFAPLYFEIPILNLSENVNPNAAGGYFGQYKNTETLAHGTLLAELSESFPMNTNMTLLGWFSNFFCVIYPQLKIIT